MTHTSTEQPEALRLADKYEVDGFLQDHRFAQDHWCRQAAAELRHQHARIEELEAQLSTIGAGGVEPLRKQAAAPQAVPDSVLKTIGWLLDDAMNAAVKNGANSISMPDDYVELAAWLAGIPTHPAEGVPAPAAVAVPDERAAFKAWLRVKPCGAAHDFAWEAWRARAALAATPAADAPMVDMTPPATSRDRWMYEQGRLAERDARTPGSVAAAAPVVLPEPDAYLYTSGNHRGVSLEWRGQSDMAEGTERHALYTEQQVRALLAAHAQADARDVELWIGIGKAIERAYMDLPDGTEISVYLEKDAGTVTLIDQDGNEYETFRVTGFAGVLNEAIDAAIAAQAKQGEAQQ